VVERRVKSQSLVGIQGNSDIINYATGSHSPARVVDVKTYDTAGVGGGRCGITPLSTTPSPSRAFPSTLHIHNV